MKCVKCETDNNLQERTKAGGRCKNCNHPFVFDPQRGSKFTDIFFSNSIQTISSENTLFFTPKQFWYLLERRLVPQTIPIGCLAPLSMIIILQFNIFLGLSFQILGWIKGSILYNYESENITIFHRCLQISRGLIILSILSFIFYVIPVKVLIFFWLFIGFEILIMYLGMEQFKKLDKLRIKSPRSLYYQQTDINEWLKLWQEINGEVTNILPPSREMNEPMQINSEVTAYSFDRVIVCDTAEIAQFLIANNFHFEHNCAVLSIDGYPQNIFSTVMQMLKQNPDLKIYAFHSATPRGVTTINELRNSPNWFSGNNLIIYDLGLLPRHVFPSKNMWILKSDESVEQGRQIPSEVKQTLSKDELEWLESGFYVELESFSPGKLLQVVSQGIAKTQAVANGYTSTSENSLDSG
ncbi:hypothetical protein, partial [Okeania sp. SIO2B3]|uniref:hypothetical protein n=1 Tax=Okeania sp. SIO2B3 TaxID=2607784 RepID=UPI0013C0E044